MSKLEEFDINDLVIKIHDELKLAFHVAQLDEVGGGIKLLSATTKLGRRKLIDGAEPDPAGIMLNRGKYPDEEDWEVVVNYSASGDSQPGKAQIGEGELQQYQLFDRLVNQPLTAIKGISTYWAGILSEYGIRTVGQLGRTSVRKMERINAQHNSFVLMEFYAKVSLLNRSYIVLKHEALKHLHFIDIILKTEKELASMFKGKMSKIELAEIRSIASLLLVVFDKEVFEDFTLGLLFD